MRVRGEWVQDRRYGAQIKVTEAQPLPPSDEPALLAYLRRVRHVGRKRAQTLLDRHSPEHVLDAIDRDATAAFTAAGLSSARPQEAAASWHELRVTRQLHLLLAPHGLTYLVTRIQSEYGATAHRIVAMNPYELTRVFGVGFAIADRIALASAASRGNGEPPGRPRAALVHLLAEAERDGNTCLPLAELVAGARRLLGGDGAPPELGRRARRRRRARARGRLRLSRRDGRARGGARRTDPGAGERAERRAPARDRPDARAGGAGLRAGTSADPEATDELALTAEQRDGVRAAFAHRLSVITGGPGTGKTATIRTIAKFAAEQNARVMLVAPTGRAATRMTEASGFRATTVHSALGWIPGEGRPTTKMTR